jgi:hypothetical protein
MAVQCMIKNEKEGKTNNLDTKINWIIAKIIKPSMTDFQKIFSIHSYIVNNVEYDTDNYFKNKIPYDDYTALGALIKGKAVCEGYAEAVAELLDKAGIENQIVTGPANGIGTDGKSTWAPHAWNLVKMNGKYYNIDATWDDGYGLNYFLVSSKQMSKDHKFGFPSLPKTDNKFDNIFPYVTLEYVGNKAIYFRDYRSQIVKIDNNGIVSKPFSKLKISPAFEPVSMDKYFYYLEDSKSLGGVLHRIEFDSEKNTVIISKIEKKQMIPIVTDKYIFYGTLDNQLLDLHRFSLDGEGDKIMAKNIFSPELGFNSKYLYFVKDESKSFNEPWNSIMSINRIPINQKGEVSLIVKENSYISFYYIDNKVLNYELITGENKTVKINP